MTLQSIRDFGVSAQCTDYRHLLIDSSQKYSPRMYPIEGDASGASYFWGIAAISGTSITVHNVNPRSSQGDTKLPALLEQMGCTITVTNDSITVTGPERLQGITANMELMPDVAQTLAVIAACAQGTSVLRGLKTLRIKETDRIQAMHNELKKAGINSEVGPDYLVIHGSNPRAAHIATYEDHRMAMSFAMLSSRVDGMVIEEPQVVAKSFPTFWDTLDQIGIQSHDC